MLCTIIRYLLPTVTCYCYIRSQKEYKYFTFFNSEDLMRRLLNIQSNYSPFWMRYLNALFVIDCCSLFKTSCPFPLQSLTTDWTYIKNKEVELKYESQLDISCPYLRLAYDDSVLLSLRFEKTEEKQTTMSLRILFLSNDVTWLCLKEDINILHQNRPKIWSVGWF